MRRSRTGFAILIMTTALITTLTMASNAAEQTNRIDVIRHDAPELAAFGIYDVGVRTTEFIAKNRVDVVNTNSGAENVMYDRHLTVEIWYPAKLNADQPRGTQYVTETRNLAVTATLNGMAVRDATALSGHELFPLVILSHGYPGNRYLMSHLGENLASKGYVVVSIDHTDSTYQNQQPIASTLYNRAPDQRVVLQKIAEMTADKGSFLAGLVDVNNTAIIGFSMGGYGLLNNLGATYNKDMISTTMAPPNELLKAWTDANPDFNDLLDPRVKAGVAIAPWGMNSGFFNPVSLRGIETPTLYVAGSMDVTAGYENGTRSIFENAVNSDRYLLTFINGGHSVAAPIPLPQEILYNEDKSGAGHYADPVWDTVRSNNILAHFVTAFLNVELKGMVEQKGYLDLISDPSEGVYSIRDGEPRPEHTYWKGFPRGTAIGLTLEHLAP